jgi:hypothetical protein
VSDIDTIVVDGLKALDPEWPIREATLLFGPANWRDGPSAEVNFKVSAKEVSSFAQ